MNVSVKYSFVRVFTCAICFGLLNSACHHTTPVAGTVVKLPTKHYQKEVVPSVQMPSDSGNEIYEKLDHPEAVYQFYRSNNFNIAWLNDSSAALVDSMLFFLRSVRLYGLLPQDYHKTEIEMLNNRVADKKLLYCKEVLLSDAFLSLTIDLKYGRLDSIVKADQDSGALQVLKQAIGNRQIKQVLESQEPIHKSYQLLKVSLRKILQSSEPADLHALLAGFTYDSILLHRKVQTIEVNMERWRAESSSLNERFVWINIPSYQLQVIENGRTVLESRIIVGKPETTTPVLSSVVECITLFPYWYIPRKIAIKEYLPEIQKDTSFLTLNNLDVLDRRGTVLDPAILDWKNYNANYFPLSLRQREGPENSLGVIKFVFDNPYAVFLHDTNARNLFRKKVRTFSHGCIRMEKAIDLAKYLVPTPGRIDAVLNFKERHTINLSNPIPIHIRYFTCEYSDGVLNFYDDIYKQDAPIIQFLYPRMEVKDL